MNDKQFETAFSSAGGWFFLNEYELIKNWKKGKRELIHFIFQTGIDSNFEGTKTRVNAALRIINDNTDERALEKIRDSRIINEKHPDAKELAELLLKKYHSEH